MTMQWYEQEKRMRCLYFDTLQLKHSVVFCSFFQHVLNLMDKVELKPDVVTYGVTAMACVNREQAQQFRDKLMDRGIR